MKSLKSQLSIFILLAVFIIILLVFLFSSAQQNQKTQIDSSSQQATSNSQGYENLVEEVDYCLLQTLRKATIIGGYLGGYIYSNPYEKGELEQYSSSVLFSNYYQDGDFLADMGINQNYLYENTLFYHTTKFHTPPLKEGISYEENGVRVVEYSRGIEDDFERYILDNIMSCLDLSKYESQGFNLHFLDVSGELFYDDGNSIAYISEMDGEKGDGITMLLDNSKYPGEIIDFNGDQVVVEFTGNPFSTSSNEPHSITNNDLGIQVDVEFQEEEITASISFPLSIKDNDDQSISSLSTSVVLDNRFSRLKELMGTIINEKHLNKEYDLTDLDLLSEILRNNSFYFASLRDPGLNFIRSQIEDTQEYKQYIYTLVDSSQKIQGQDFLFNAAYKNDAPYIDLSDPELGCSNINPSTYDVFEDEERLCFLQIASDVLVTKNLTKFAVDKQDEDRHHLRFYPQEEDSTYYFKLKETGRMEFRGSYGTRKDILIGDGETSREYSFRFITTAGSNQNNELASSCLLLSNSHQLSDEFPIDNPFLDRVFIGEDGSNEMPFGYVLNTVSDKAKLKVSQSCFYNSNNLDVEVSFEDMNENNIGSSSVQLSDTIDLPNRNNYYKVIIQVKDGSGTQLLSNPYEMIIYPVSCLGPYEEVDSGVNFGTCCDMGALETHSEKSNHPTPISSTLKNSGEVFNEELYFGIANFYEENIKENLNLESEILWDHLSEGERVSALYKGDVRAVCGGNYPRWIENIESVSSSSNDETGTFKELVTYNSFLGTSENYFTKDVPFSLSIKNSGTICADVKLWDNDNLPAFKDSNGVWYLLGLQGQQIPYVYTENSNDPKPYVLCEDNWYGSVGGSNSWLDSVIDWKKEDMRRSKGYCGVNSKDCNRYRVDDRVEGGECRETRFDGNDLSARDIPDGTSCGTPIIDENYNSTHREIINFECSIGSCEALDPIYEEK